MFIYFPNKWNKYPDCSHLPVCLKASVHFKQSAGWIVLQCLKCPFWQEDNFRQLSFSVSSHRAEQLCETPWMPSRRFVRFLVRGQRGTQKKERASYRGMQPGGGYDSRLSVLPSSGSVQTQVETLCWKHTEAFISLSRSILCSEKNSTIYIYIEFIYQLELKPSWHYQLFSY